jgi:hypothetical protein
MMRTLVYGRHPLKSSATSAPNTAPSRACASEARAACLEAPVDQRRGRTATTRPRMPRKVARTGLRRVPQAGSCWCARNSAAELATLKPRFPQVRLSRRSPANLGRLQMPQASRPSRCRTAEVDSIQSFSGWDGVRLRGTIASASRGSRSRSCAGSVDAIHRFATSSARSQESPIPTS